MAKSLVGLWTNGTCTEVKIEEPEPGKLSGWYKIAVGTPREVEVPMAGLVNHTKADCPNFSFCVSMEAIGGDTCNAVVGQYFNHSGEELLKTMWLMRAGVTNCEDNWGATKVGENTFRRKAP
ncbi:avidin-related protein 3-like [Engraulis encrasicolus]|uniref:avidin-related protein 3-like n=1 Tax=Engraulis encrasicolus TaxID=184585 RepID=UPI002FCF1337